MRVLVVALEFWGKVAMATRVYVLVVTQMRVAAVLVEQMEQVLGGFVARPLVGGFMAGRVLFFATLAIKKLVLGLMEQFVSFGPVALGLSHQQELETNNESLY